MLETLQENVCVLSNALGPARRQMKCTKPVPPVHVQRGIALYHLGGERALPTVVGAASVETVRSNILSHSDSNKEGFIIPLIFQ